MIASVFSEVLNKVKSTVFSNKQNDNSIDKIENHLKENGKNSLENVNEKSSFLNAQNEMSSVMNEQNDSVNHMTSVSVVNLPKIDANEVRTVILVPDGF